MVRLGFAERRPPDEKGQEMSSRRGDAVCLIFPVCRNGGRGLKFQMRCG
jgi:hypothetical protein